jgi:hypothetical protein
LSPNLILKVCGAEIFFDFFNKMKCKSFAMNRLLRTVKYGGVGLVSKNKGIVLLLKISRFVFFKF